MELDELIPVELKEAEKLELEKVERYTAAHDAAVARGLTTYVDPDTGYQVFTELSHQRRGKCCGNVCRHCPFGHANVPAWRKELVEKRKAVAAAAAEAAGRTSER